jgi:hypothetical protein
MGGRKIHSRKARWKKKSYKLKAYKKKIKLKRILERVRGGKLYCGGTGYRQVVGCCGHGMEA